MADQRLIEIFLQLISIEGLSGSEQAVASNITSFLRDLGLSPFEDNSKRISLGNTGNIICPIGTGGEFVLISHMDTARSTKDVKPKILEDRITSDGSTVLGVDNRAGISAILYAVEKAVKEKIPLKDFTIAFTTNEETTLAGSRYIELDEKIRMGFVFDSHLRPGCFIKESCGAVGFYVRVLGKASHSGIAPEKGIDSISIASMAISKIKLGRIDRETTANIGTIKGGSAVNVVPEETYLEGEVRSMNPDKVMAKLKEIIKKFEEKAEDSGGKIEFEYQWDFRPYRIDPDSKIYKKVTQALESAGLKPEGKVSWGGSDANSLNERGIQCVNLGIGAENPHGNDEFILLEDLQKASEIALGLIRK